MSVLWLVVLYCLTIAVVAAHAPHNGNRITPRVSRLKQNGEGEGGKFAATHVPSQKLVHTLRGGFDLNDLLKRQAKPIGNTGSTDVVVATSIGSTFLDKKKKLSIARNETVHDLKVQISKKFPGSPPVSLQKLYFISRLLDNNETIGNISIISPIPIVLDMVSGTSVYNRNMTVSQALEAYAASVVQQSYLGAQLQALYKPESNETEPMASPRLRELFHAINASVYERYHDAIAAAKLRESEPERASSDTAAWRSQKTVSPLTAAIAKEFDLNWRGVRQYAFYSLVLIVSELYCRCFFCFIVESLNDNFSLLLQVFSYFGTATPEAAALLLYLIPVLWISKLRQLRLIFKVQYCRYKRLLCTAVALISHLLLFALPSNRSPLIWRCRSSTNMTSCYPCCPRHCRYHWCCALLSPLIFVMISVFRNGRFVLCR